MALLAQLRTAVTQTLRRVAPDASLSTGDDSFMIELNQPRYEVVGLIQANGRHGSIRVVASRDHPDMSCTGYAASACHLVVGPQGQTSRVTHFERAVKSGQPRDLEYQTEVAWPDGSVVFIALDNADTLPPPGLAPSLPPRTGVDPPLTFEQVAALAADPAVDLCAKACSGPRPYN
jgi:hypothetical protein